MRRIIAAAALAATMQGGAYAQSSRFIAMENAFEQRIHALELEEQELSQAEINERAAPVAESVYGADWRVVATESRRILRSLPEFDLAPYASAEAQTPFADSTHEWHGALAAAMQSRGQSAALRFYDARHVGIAIATTAVSMVDQEAMSFERVIVSGMFSNRTFRGRAGGEPVLVTRMREYVVVTPYAIGEAGMIQPALGRVRVYRRL
jgi:hypothetical protein